MSRIYEHFSQSELQGMLEESENRFEECRRQLNNADKQAARDIILLIDGIIIPEGYNALEHEENILDAIRKKFGLEI